MLNKIPYILRKAGLMMPADKIRFIIQYFKTASIRKQFVKEYPEVKLPPAYFMYETFNLNYHSFYTKSIDSANWLIDHFKQYKSLENLKILDWGCGPGRVLRHLPRMLDKSNDFFGTDYNKKYVKWCQKNIPDVQFKQNQLTPPLEFEANTFDIIYGVSIFTHLSEDMHHKWFDELLRVLKSGGILLITLQGDIFRSKLSDEEKKSFDNGSLVIKANTKEGHRTYSAFQPDAFVTKLIGSNKLLKHDKGVQKKGWIEQDTWIIQKK